MKVSKIRQNSFVFALIGALYGLLKLHPDIRMTQILEINFFDKYKRYLHEKEYDREIMPNSTENQIIMEWV